jgi:hypothetical protein
MPNAFSPEAEAAFGRLLAIGPNREERRELQSAGIVQSTIDSLYPVEFVDLAPFLIKHIDSLRVEHIFKRVSTKTMDLHQREADSLLPDEAVQERRYEIMMDSGWVDLRLHLRATWKAKEGKRRAPASADGHPTLLRIAYWYMTNAPSLPQRARDSASKLMVEVAEAWLLPAA